MNQNFPLLCFVEWVICETMWEGQEDRNAVERGLG